MIASFNRPSSGSRFHFAACRLPTHSRRLQCRGPPDIPVGLFDIVGLAVVVRETFRPRVTFGNFR
jgi:hypothetical protein